MALKFSDLGNKSVGYANQAQHEQPPVVQEEQPTSTFDWSSTWGHMGRQDIDSAYQFLRSLGLDVSTPEVAWQNWQQYQPYYQNWATSGADIHSFPGHQGYTQPKPSITGLENKPTGTVGTYGGRAADIYGTLMGAVGDIANYQYNPITGQWAAANKPTAVSGLGQGYFDTMRDTLKEELRNEFFGRGGEWDTARSEESAAGRLGSRVSIGQLQKAVAEPYTKRMGQIDVDVMQKQQEDQARVDAINSANMSAYQGTLADLSKTDASNNVAVANMKNNLTQQLMTLATSLTEAETDDQIDLIEASMNGIMAAWQNYNTGLGLSLEYTNIPYPSGEQTTYYESTGGTPV